MRIHLIAIGGAVMHNLALALKENGHQVSGSDDHIAEPSFSRLQSAGLLPEAMGWNPDKITPDLDLVILGMHAREDNPELLQSQKLGVPVQSFPEFLYTHSADKTRLVIAGSHGKTTTTAMVMHVLRNLDRNFDYMVGSQLAGFNTMVRLSEAPIMVLEGDEYLTSPIDRKPKFLWYKPQMAMITGIAWDHINVFPTWENYVEQFRLFLSSLPDGAPMIYFQGDETLHALAQQEKSRLKLIPYTTPENKLIDGTTHFLLEGKSYPMQVFGDHILQNMEGARLLCAQIGIPSEDFLLSMQSFTGAARRMEKISETEKRVVFRDFAHSPSKLKATLAAIEKQYAGKKILACMELHTFSSLNPEFLSQYKNSFSDNTTSVVYFDENVLNQKRMALLSEDQVRSAFNKPDLRVIREAADFASFLEKNKDDHAVILLMSSGTFSGYPLENLK